jgi:hypothetical protein
LPPPTANILPSKAAPDKLPFFRFIEGHKVQLS